MFGIACLPCTPPAQRNLHSTTKKNSMVIELQPFYVTGFTDGEASFIIVIERSPTKIG